MLQSSSVFHSDFRAGLAGSPPARLARPAHGQSFMEPYGTHASSCEVPFESGCGSVKKNGFLLSKHWILGTLCLLQLEMHTGTY